MRPTQLPGGAGFNLARIAVGYKHFEDDARPFEIKADGFRHLDERSRRSPGMGVLDRRPARLPGHRTSTGTRTTHARRGVLAAPAFPGSGLPCGRPLPSTTRHPWVAGYNLLNEPSDESRKVVGPFYRRLVTAIRAVDPDHTVFLDGNTYATEFDVFDEPFENAVYTLHDYVPAGLGRSPHYSREEAEQKFLQRSATRVRPAPILVGDSDRSTPATDPDAYLRGFSPTSSPSTNATKPVGAWMYKDIGRQGLVSCARHPYGRGSTSSWRRDRLAADQWGSDGIGVAEVTQPVPDLIAREFPDFDPYPWGGSTGCALAAQHHVGPAARPHYAAVPRARLQRARRAGRTVRVRSCEVRKPLLQSPGGPAGSPSERPDDALARLDLGGQPAGWSAPPTTNSLLASACDLLQVSSMRRGPRWRRPCRPRSGWAVLAPIESQEVWARASRTSEPGRTDRGVHRGRVYERVIRPNPEVFFKLWPRVVGDGQPVGVRADSPLNARSRARSVLNAAGEVFGYVPGNDVAAAPSKGEPALPPQAKVYERSCSLGPGIVPVWRPPLPFRSRCVSSAGTQSPSRVRPARRALRAVRGPLAADGRPRLPVGAILLTGTGIVPDESFSLQAGDRVTVDIEGIGALTNPVVQVGRNLG